MSTNCLAVSKSTILAPKAIIWALLCSLIRAAVFVSEHTPALMPFTLLQAIEMPTPVPQMAIPFHIHRS